MSNKSNLNMEEESLNSTPISSHQADKLRKQALEVHALLAKFNETFTTDTSEHYYILSKRWFDQWKKYVSYDEIIANRPPAPTFGRINLPIANQDIYDNVADACFKYSPLREHPWNIWIKGPLAYNEDYIIINKEIWNTLTTHQTNNYSILRTPHGEGNQKQVIVNLFKFQALLLYPSIISQIANDNYYKPSFDKEFLQVDRNMKLKDYIALIQRTVPTFRGDYAKDNGVRLWRYAATSNDPQKPAPEVQKALYGHIRKQVQDLEYGDELSFDFVGEYLDPTRYETIEDIGILDTDLIIVEFKAQNKPWCIRNPAVLVEGRCDQCRQVKVLNFPCVCRKVNYCSEDCKQQDEKYHLGSCERQGSDDEAVKAIVESANSAKGVTGLANLGNTCFMNSGIQCLSNSYPLTEYFLTNVYFNEINEENPLGTKGKLVRKYGSLLKKMWFGEKGIVTPTNFKKAVGQFQPMFKGYHQHDSSELITFLLDGIHEDLNRVKVKPYVETKDSEGRKDFDVARESWENYLARNQSIVVDLMYGQYKSTLKCPNCARVSITFDPFLMVQLAIPNHKKKFLQFRIYNTLLTYTYKTIPYEKGKNLTVLDFKHSIEQDLNVDAANTILYIPTTYATFDAFPDQKPLYEVRKQAKKNVLCVRQLSDLERAIPLTERVYLSFQNKGQDPYGSYKRTLYNNGIICLGVNFTLKQVHLMIFKLLFQLFSELRENNFNDEQEAQEFYETTVHKKYYVLEYKTNSSFWQSCSFCGKKQCPDCEVAYSDDTVEMVKQKVLQSDPQCTVEFSILWTNSPYKGGRVFEVFEVFGKLVGQGDDNQPKIQNSFQMQSKVTLQDCLSYSAQPEQLAADNAWYCRSCKDHIQAYKSMQIYKAPKILIFTLKRFKAQNRIFKQKLETLVDFPVKNLDLTDYIINTKTPPEYNTETNEVNGEQKKEGQRVIYDLFAISNHFGGLGGGHYTAYAKNHFNQKWYNFDDSHVSQVSEDSIVSKSAYVLFYQLRTEDQNQQQQTQNIDQTTPEVSKSSMEQE